MSLVDFGVMAREVGVSIVPLDSGWTGGNAFGSEKMHFVKDPKIDLHARIPHGDGQTVLREAVLIVDHNSYHIGEFAILRQVQKNWK